MISLTCTSCKRSLEIDDAFAGGVCRCQFCGTIQTVPAGLKKGGRPATPVGSSPATQKMLYQRKAPPKHVPPAGATTPLPESPAAGDTTPRGLRAARPEPAQTDHVRRKTWLIAIAIGAAAAIVIGVLAWIAL